MNRSLHMKNKCDINLSLMNIQIYLYRLYSLTFYSLHSRKKSI